MEEKVSVKPFKKKSNIIIFIITSICLIGLIGVGISYAYWIDTKTSENTNVVNSGCFDVTLSDEKNPIVLENAYPITNEEGKKLKPYTFTITNNCSIFAKYDVNLEMLEGTTLSSKYVAVRVNNEEVKKLSEVSEALAKSEFSLSTSTESRTIATGYLGTNDSVEYSVSLWIHEDTTVEDLVDANGNSEAKSFKSKIVVKAVPSSYSPVDSGYNTLHDAILANEYQTTPALAIEQIKAKQSANITTTDSGIKVTNTAPVIKWLEKSNATQTNTVVVPAASVVDNDTSSDESSNLTTNDTMMRLYKTKTFNSETGRYSLSNYVYVDPTTITYGGDTHYYYQTQSIAYNTATGKLYSSIGSGDITIYEVTGATKSDTQTTWHNIKYDSTTFKLTVTPLVETELESDKSDKGLYAGTDDYGTTYYYRGNVKNNNVLFAGYYWQIVRINGDGSIRLIYNGSKANATGTAQSINTRNYQFNSKYNDPAYVGYMYGDADAETFDEVHANTNDSTIKTAVDSWYKTNIADKGYSSYISTSVGFCGDRSLATSASGDGIQTNKDSHFGALGRHYNYLAQFTCPNTGRDMYTVSKSDGETRTVDGNQALTYPVGLITYDELVFAGMDNRHLNKLSWAYSTNHYWTMSPSSFSAYWGYAYGWFQYSAGYLDPWWYVAASFGARPVINLKSDALISGGIGTSSSPFVIKTSN